MSNRNKDIQDILYIQVMRQKITKIEPYDFKDAEDKLRNSFPLEKLLTELNWAFLNGVKRKFTHEKKDFWINLKKMQTGKRTGDLYAFMFIDEFYYIITQSRPAGSYKIGGKYQDKKEG